MNKWMKKRMDVLVREANQPGMDMRGVQKNSLSAAFRLSCFDSAQHDISGTPPGGGMPFFSSIFIILHQLDGTG